MPVGLIFEVDRVSLNIAKGTTDPRVEFILQIWIKFQVQNLDKAFTSKSQPNISISTKSKVKILTKPIDQDSTS